MSEATPNDPGCVRCPHCEGEGYGVRLYMAGPGDVGEESYECGACDGSGIIDVDELGLGDLLEELDFAELLDLAIALAPDDEYMGALDHDPPEPGLRKILATLPARAAAEHARYLIRTRDICDQALDVWAWSTSEAQGGEE